MFFFLSFVTVQIQHYCLYSDSSSLLSLVMPSAFSALINFWGSLYKAGDVDYARAPDGTFVLRSISCKLMSSDLSMFLQLKNR